MKKIIGLAFVFSLINVGNAQVTNEKAPGRTGKTGERIHAKTKNPQQTGERKRC